VARITAFAAVTSAIVRASRAGATNSSRGDTNCDRHSDRWRQLATPSTPCSRRWRLRRTSRYRFAEALVDANHATTATRRSNSHATSSDSARLPPDHPFL